MPGRRRTQEAPPPTAIVGAARRLHLNRREEITRVRERGPVEWQQRAWRHFDEIGEIKYAFNYFAAIASRVRLYAGFQEETSDAPVPVGDVGELSRSFVTAARYEVQKLSNGRAGQPSLLRTLVLNLSIAGEAYLIGRGNQYTIRSTSELRWGPTGQLMLVSSKYNPTNHMETLPDDAYVVRIWRNHPQYSDDCDSSLKGVEKECAELLLLSRVIRASGKSKLNAGILAVAEELRFQRTHTSGDEPTDASTQLDPFEEELEAELEDPIGETDSPAEIMPMLMRVPAEYMDKAIKHVDLSRGFDEETVKRHAETLMRVMNGLDIPKDIITGLSHVRYSNAREIIDDMYRAHVEPMIVMICDALTNVYLRPMMLARGYDPEYVDRLNIWYDPSEVVSKPDRSTDADTGYERLLVSGASWRRAHGFSDGDAPTPEEIVTRIALGGTVAPAVVAQFMRAIAPNFVGNADKLANAAFTPSPDSGSGPAGTTSSPPDTQMPQGQDSPSGSGVNTGGSSGSSEPPEGSLPTPDSNARADQMNAAEILETLRAMTAATNASSEAVRGRTRRLERALDVERRLRDSLFTHLNDVVARAVDRAGARVVSKTRGDSSLKAEMSMQPMASVFATVPEDRRTEFGLDAEKLVADTLNGARDGFLGTVRDAQALGWSALDPAVAEALASDQEAHLSRAWEWLRPELIKSAAAKLENPGSDAHLVSMGTVREAMARAGGKEGDEETVRPMSGRAVLSASALDATGWSFSERYRWIYGVSDNTFHPHLELDDTVFASWSADTLKNHGDFPKTEFLYPGDHDGCRCDWLPEVLDPEMVNAPYRFEEAA